MGESIITLSQDTKDSFNIMITGKSKTETDLCKYSDPSLAKYVDRDVELRGGAGWTHSDTENQANSSIESICVVQCLENVRRAVPTGKYKYLHLLTHFEKVAACFYCSRLDHAEDWPSRDFYKIYRPAPCAHIVHFTI
jgi:hypothetical protein